MLGRKGCVGRAPGKGPAAPQRHGRRGGAGVKAEGVGAGTVCRAHCRARARVGGGRSVRRRARGRGGFGSVRAARWRARARPRPGERAAGAPRPVWHAMHRVQARSARSEAHTGEGGPTRGGAGSAARHERAGADAAALHSQRPPARGPDATSKSQRRANSVGSWGGGEGGTVGFPRAFHSNSGDRAWAGPGLKPLSGAPSVCPLPIHRARCRAGFQSGAGSFPRLAPSRRAAARGAPARKGAPGRPRAPMQAATTPSGAAAPAAGAQTARARGVAPSRPRRPPPRRRRRPAGRRRWACAGSGLGLGFAWGRRGRWWRGEAGTGGWATARGARCRRGGARPGRRAPAGDRGGRGGV